MNTRNRLGAAWLAAVGSLWSTFIPAAQAPQTAATQTAALATVFPDDVPKPPYKRIPDGPITLNPGTGQDHFRWSDMYDSALAAPEVHHVRFMNEHVRLVEVGYFPGVRGRMHGHAYNSVFAIDAPAPKSVNARLVTDPVIWGEHPGPNGQDFPICRSMGPQDPHAETNLDTYPHHFLRLEFLRVDGAGLADHWREWYPRLTQPTPGGTSRLLWEDNHARLIEVSLRPGETEAMHGNPYPAVLAFDSVPPASLPVRYQSRTNPLNGSDMLKTTPPPGLQVPLCATTGPQAPRALTNNTKSLVHYYRIEFKRIDGNDLRTRWAEFYPWLAEYKKAWDAKPYAFNY